MAITEADVVNTSVSSTRLPAEARVLALIILFDAVGGMWLAIHNPGALSKYLGPQVPALGLAGIAWGFLPDTTKKQVGAWVAGKLATRWVPWLIAIIGSAGLALTALTSGVTVRSVEPDGSTQLYLIDGDRETPRDSGVLAHAAELRLNRVTTPVHWFQFGSPLGHQVWVYTPTRVSGNRHSWPWIPISLDYPDDFEEMVTIAVLPDQPTLEKLAVEPAVFRLFSLTGRDSILIAQGELRDHGSFVAFTRPKAIGKNVTDRWSVVLAERNKNDLEAVPQTLKDWEALDATDRWIRAFRPLVFGQLVGWSVTTKGDNKTIGGRLTLNDDVSDVFFKL